jgi:hypothetical protein
MRRNSPAFLLVMASTALGLIAASVEAFARAGGGGGGGRTIHWILWLILLPVVIIYAEIVAYSVRKKYRQCRELLEQLEQTDASWDLRNIERRVERIYFKVQEAWMQRDQSIAREFMSDRLYEKHKLQTDLMLSNHRKNMLEDITLKQSKVVNVSNDVDDSKDYLWVYIEGSMIDYVVNDETGKRASEDSPRRKGFTELWKLVRGKTGWVLDEIEQAGISALLKLRPSSQETGFVHRPAPSIRVGPNGPTLD